jgi:hypothetical protein
MPTPAQKAPKKRRQSRQTAPNRGQIGGFWGCFERKWGSKELILSEIDPKFPLF